MRSSQSGEMALSPRASARVSRSPESSSPYRSNYPRPLILPPPSYVHVTSHPDILSPYPTHRPTVTTCSSASPTASAPSAPSGGVRVVKVCGVMSPEDATLAASNGANLIGVILATGFKVQTKHSRRVWWSTLSSSSSSSSIRKGSVAPPLPTPLTLYSLSSFHPPSPLLSPRSARPLSPSPGLSPPPLGPTALSPSVFSSRKTRPPLPAPVATPTSASPSSTGTPPGRPWSTYPTIWT